MSSLLGLSSARIDYQGGVGGWGVASFEIYASVIDYSFINITARIWLNCSERGNNRLPKGTSPKDMKGNLLSSTNPGQLIQLFCYIIFIPCIIIFMFLVMCFSLNQPAHIFSHSSWVFTFPMFNILHNHVFQLARIYFLLVLGTYFTQVSFVLFRHDVFPGEMWRH